MALYDGVPSIRLEGDEVRALALIPEAKALLYKVQTFLRNSGVGTYSMSRRVGQDAYIYALCANGLNILHISVAPQGVDVTDKEQIFSVNPTLFPDFYSGLVYHGFFETKTRTDENGDTVTYSVCDSFSPTQDCLQNHKELVYQRQDVARLAVRPHASLPELEAGANSLKTHTQYAELRSSMYSGLMKEVVQVVMGLGRIGKDKIRDPSHRGEDTKYVKDVHAAGVQIRYDYKFHRTHGINIASDGRLWLIEISMTRGVLARPLPIFTKSNTQGFYDRADAIGDGSMKEALDLLGCLPTGETFPSVDAALEALIASGEVLRLMEPGELTPIYGCSPYSTAMGWAFNNFGTEAHNTAYHYGEEGFQRGVWYQINISIGPILTNREPNAPVANGFANLVRQRSDFIYCPPVPGNSAARYTPIKFYEPLIFGLLSHEGTPTINANSLPAPMVDTVMYVCFIDDDFHAIRYYRNPEAGVFTETTDTAEGEQCLYAGSWNRTVLTGMRSFPGMMYTNEIDDRRVLQENVRVTDTTSVDLGFDPPKFSDFLQSPEACFVWRDKIFKKTVHTEISGGETLSSIIAVPRYSREAYYYATGGNFTTGRSTNTAITFDSLRDPNVGYGWRCFPRQSIPPWPVGIGCATDVCGGRCSSGGQGVHKERRVVCLDTQNTLCNDIANEGVWLTVCDIVDGFNQTGMPKNPVFTTTNYGTDDKASLFLVSSRLGYAFPIPVTYSQYINHWALPSPDPESGNIQLISSMHNCLGADAVVYDTNLSSYAGSKLVLGYTTDTIGPNDGYPCFIGVNG